MKMLKKPVSILLALVMVFSSCMIFASAEEATAYVPDYDTETPVVFIHGMGQNNVYVVDDEGNRLMDDSGDYITVWPLELNIMGLLKNALPGLLMSAITRKDSGFTEGMYKGAQEALYTLEKDAQGNYIQPVETPCLEYSFAEMTEAEKEERYEHIPIQELTDVIGEENVYYFGYDTFGNVKDAADYLHYYINEIVLPQTGAEQVTICPISLGGTIAVQYLDSYPEDYELLKRVLFFVPAIDGSDIVGSLLTDELSVFYDDDTLYKDLIVHLLGDSFLSYLINILLRILPTSVLKDGLKALAHGVVQVGIRSCTQMWALCPTDYYEQAREMWLSDEEYASIRDQVDEFMVARSNFTENLETLMAGGTECFDLVAYDTQLFPLCKDYRTTNADIFIQADSTSMGATFSDLETTLPDDYTQAGTYCSDPANHNHISPDRMVDPTTGLLAETTWYIKGQPHDRLASNDAAITLCVQVLCDDNMKDVHSNPEAFPQYNGYRLSRDAKANIALWNETDKSGFTQAEIMAVDDAAARINALLEETVVDTQAWADAEADLNAALVNVGLMEDTTPSTFEQLLTAVARVGNIAVNKVFEGGNK